MKKITALCFLLASISNFAQQNNLDSISNWTKKGTFTLLFNQASFSNWIAGGENAVSGTVSINYDFNYKKGDWAWDNKIITKYGISNISGTGSRKTDDQFEFNSLVSKKASNYWSYSFFANVRTQFTTGYDSPPLKPTVGPASISKGIANHFGRESTMKNVDNFQKTLVKYIDENRWDKTFQLELWALHNENVSDDWRSLISITQEEIKMNQPEGQYLRYQYDIIPRRISWVKWCIQSGYNIMAKYLLNEFYSDRSRRRDNYLDNFLLIAVENDSKEIITDLLNNGADPNIKDETTGKTPLMLAIEKRNVELAKELLRHKADTSNIKDNNGRTATDIAKGTEHKEIIRLLRPFSTAVNELRQDMRSNGVSRTKDNNKYLNVVAYPPLSKEIQGYLGEGGKRKKKIKEKQNKSHKRRKTRKSKSRKSKKNRTKKYKH